MTATDRENHSTERLVGSLWQGMSRDNLVTRVANAIREQVQSGQLASGAKLRGEVEFARELGISRQTLREATRLLAREGLLTIRHGVGTFVAESSGYLSSPLDTMNSMSALIREKGGEARVDALKIRSISATSEIATALGIAEGSTVAEIVRLRLIGSKSLAVAYDYIELIDSEKTMTLIKTFDGGSIYEFMAAKLLQKLVLSESTVTAVAASKKHADLLNVKKGFPLLLIREVQFDSQRRRALYSAIYHNSSMVEFTLVRPGMRA
jgi:GntR family transcriptional regulator